MNVPIETLREQPGVKGLVQLAHNAIVRINELECEVARLSELLANQLANQPKTSGSPLPGPHKRAVFCAGCRKEWSVPYEHSGKSFCANCEAKLRGEPEQGPVAVVVDPYDAYGLQWLCQHPPHRGDKLYLSPPKREWVGLMDEEFMAIAQKYSLATRVGLEYFKDELEAKLKEKNNG